MTMTPTKVFTQLNKIARHNQTIPILMTTYRHPDGTVSATDLKVRLSISKALPPCDHPALFDTAESLAMLGVGGGPVTSGHDIDMYPQLSLGEPVYTTCVSMGALISAAGYASKDGARPTLTCVHLSSGHIEATHGHALATYDDHGLVNVPDTLFPADYLRRLAPCFDTKQLATLLIYDGHISLTQGPVTLTIRRFEEGAYPNTSTLLPTDEPKASITLTTTRLICALKFANARNLKADSGVCLTVSDTELTITGKQTGTQAPPVALPRTKNTPTHVYLNPDLGYPYLKGHKGEVTLELRGPRKPVVLRKDASSTLLVMPMRGWDTEE